MATWLASASWGSVALKAALMYAVALVGLRVAHRRTLAQWTATDFAAAVAVGAIIGRTAIAQTQSLWVGVVALVTILLVHGVVTYARFWSPFRSVSDHRVRVLVHDGQMNRRGLLLAGVPEEDLYAELRLQGVFALEEVRFVLYESKGGLTVVHRDQSLAASHLLQRGLDNAPASAKAQD